MVKNDLPEEYLISKEFARFVVDYYEYLGYSDYLETENVEETVQQAQVWFNAMIVRNRYFPINLPIIFVLESYYDDLNNGKTEKPYANLHSQVTCFRMWLQSHSELLYEQAYRNGILQRPKELQASNPISEDQRKNRQKGCIKALKEIYGEKYRETRAYKAIIKEK